jgi:tetratricopeptide (TPR) repeat protein
VNKSAFLHLIRNASAISAQEADELEELVVNFPYCQTAHLLIAKAAYDRGSMLSNQKLRKAASYATNRQLLKKLIYTTAADVTLKEVTAPAAEEPKQTPAASFLIPQPAEEPPVEGLIAPEISTELGALEGKEKAGPDSTVTPKDRLEESVADQEPEQMELEEEEVTRILALEELLQEQTPDAPAFTSHNPASAPAEAENTFADNEEGKEDLHEELAELLYIDRIMPYRHLLPEQSESVQDKEENNQPIPLPQFANPSLTNDEVAALKKLVQSEEQVSGGVSQSAEHSGEANAEEKLPQEPVHQVMQKEAESTEESGVYPTTQETNKPEGREEDPEELVEPERQQVEPPIFEAVIMPREEEHVEDDTLARFDAFLFHPERDRPELQVVEEEGEITTTYPADVIERIYTQNQLGYWMNSSRLGESLEVKNELTSTYPFHFHPELILEYVQVNEVEKQARPAGGPLDQQLNLIDQFLKLNPRLKQFADSKVKPEPQEDLSSKSTKIKKSLASENLATIFVKQGKIKKAIKIYEHLIVKMPEKKAYFANQIENLKNIT